MHPEEIKTLIQTGFPGDYIEVTGDQGKFTAIVVSELFENKSMLAEQKMVYATVKEHIQSGALHALTIKAYTPIEWQSQQSF